jgi:hypothetical protein
MSTRTAKASTEVLLIAKVLIRGNEQLESVCLGRGKQLAVRQLRPASLPSGYNLVP